MKTTHIKVDPAQPATMPKGRVDYAHLDATSERAIARQQKADDADTLQETAKFARRTRQRLGLTQQEFSLRIDMPVETIRSREQGKRSPTGTAKALLRILDRAPEVALEALG